MSPKTLNIQFRRLHCISAGQCFYDDMQFVLRLKAGTAPRLLAYNLHNLHVGERMQSQHRGECTREKGNDLQHLPSEINQVYRDTRDYNLRNRSENKPGSTGGDELREVMDSFR